MHRQTHLFTLLTIALLGRAGPAAPTVVAPVAGESWAVGSEHHVTWNAADFPGVPNLGFAFSADGGRTWAERNAAVPNTGRLRWRVPPTVAPTCMVRLTTPTAKAESASFAIIPSQEVPDYEWVNVTMKAPFAPRDGAGALTFRGRLWFLGGWNPGDKRHFPRICNNEVWSSADGANWTLEKPNTFLDRSFDPARDWEGRHTAGYVVFKDRMWIVGGDVNQGHYHDDVWNSTDGKTWARVTAKVPWGPRALHYTAAFRDRIWVLGGQTVPDFAPGTERFYRDIWTSADGATWEEVKPQEPCWSARGMIGGATVFRDRLWVLGGGTYDTPKQRERAFHNDVWSTADGVAWRRHVVAAPWEPRQYHDVAVYDDRLWVMEGYHKVGGNRKDVWYSADGVNWYEVPNTPWKPRHAASVYVHDGSLWMVAGNNMESDVWRLRRRGTGR